MIEPIILIKLNKNIIIKPIPNGVPVANVINILENETNDETNDETYYNNFLYYNNNYVIGKYINI